MGGYQWKGKDQFYSGFKKIRTLLGVRLIYL